MICDGCEGWGNSQKKREWTFNQEEACQRCGGEGQYPSPEDQTFIITQCKNGAKQQYEVFAVQGNWRKELIGEIEKGNLKQYYSLLEKARTQPNIEAEQIRTALEIFSSPGASYA